MRNAARSVLVVFLILVSAAAHAAQSPAPDFIGSTAQQELSRIKAAFPRWTSVSMRVGLNGSFCDINEGSLRINLNGSKTSWGSWNISGSADNKFVNLNLNPVSNTDPNRGYNAWGSGVNVSVNPSGDGWSLFGSVDGRNFSMNLNHFGGGWSVWGQGGTSLNASSFGNGLLLSGSVDLAQFDKKSLAVLGSVLAAVQSVRLPPAPNTRGSR
ncbi:MAG: hypothetical protein HY077_17270 [Elusimicrobia bacterium]|nr:hypothetical protein [Elusimicrobiota bacterium]